mgnify:CR=1 FL=1
MRSHFTRALFLIAALGLAAAGCGKYSINNLRATQAFQTANEQYKKAEYKAAITEYSRAVQLNPDLGYAYLDRKSTRLNSSHVSESRMPSSA